MPNHPLLHSLVQVARRLDSGIPHVFPHQSGTRKDEKAFAQRCCYHVSTLESFVRCCSKDWSTSVLNTCQPFGSNCCFLLSSFKSLCSLSKRPNQSTSLLLSRCQSCSSFQLINVYTKGPLIVFASITHCLLQHGPSSLLGWHNLPDPLLAVVQSPYRLTLQHPFREMMSGHVMHRGHGSLACVHA